MAIVTWCNRIIRFGFILTLGLVPLLLTPWNYELFEYNKMMAVYALATVIVGAWIVKSIKQKEIRIPKTPLDVPILLFVLSQFVSTLFSMDPHVSWLGYYSRFNGGMWSIVSYTLLYYAFVSNIAVAPKEKTASKTTFTALKGMLVLVLVSGVLIAVYGALERMGIDKSLWVQDVQNRVFSTLGQPNWLAAYFAVLIPVALAFAVLSMPAMVSTSLYTLIALGIFIVLLFTRSRSGLFGFVLADITFWMFILARTGLKKIQSSPLATPVLILHAVLLVIVFFHGTSIPQVDRFVTLKGILSQATPASRELAQKEATAAAVGKTAQAGPALEVGGTESGTIRKYVWQAALTSWKSSTKTTLIGTGTETFAFAFYQFRPVGHNRTSEWDFLYNKAHNEYLNYLATTGLFGLGSYLLFLGVFILWFVNTVKHESDESVYTLASALFAGWLSILITNFFGFSVVIIQVFLFLIPAMIYLLLVSSPKERVVPLSDTDAYLSFLPVTIRTRALTIAIWVFVLLTLGVLFKIGSYWYADTLYATGYRSSRSGLYGQSIRSVSQAIMINPGEPLYHDELAGSYATLAVAAFEGGNATQAAQLATLAIDENEKSLKTSPKNINFIKTQTKVFYTLSSINPVFNTKAVETLQKAIPLSPNDPKIYYNLAILVGREGKEQDAINYLLKAKSLKPDYRDVYYALWVFYTEGKKTKEAKDILTEYLTKVDANDKDFQDRLK